MELLQNLGIDWRLLLAQLINFAILLAVLYKFLYKPVLKMLHSRSEKIENSLKNADAVEKKLKQAMEMYDAKIAEARKESQKIVDQVQKDAEAQRVILAKKAQEEAEAIISAGKKQLEADKEKMLKEAEVELIDLVAMATESVLGDIVTPEIDKMMIDQAIGQAKIGRA